MCMCVCARARVDTACQQLSESAQGFAHWVQSAGELPARAARSTALTGGLVGADCGEEVAKLGGHVIHDQRVNRRCVALLHRGPDAARRSSKTEQQEQSPAMQDGLTSGCSRRRQLLPVGQCWPIGQQLHAP